MKTPFRTCLIMGLLLLSVVTFSSVPTPKTRGAKTTVTFDVYQSFWGYAANRTVEAYPGQMNVPFTVIVQNIDTNSTKQHTVNAIRATLSLPSPDVTDISGTTTAYSSYSSASGVPPGGWFSLTFKVNINASATPKNYYCAVSLKYLVALDSTTWVEGEPQSTVTAAIMTLYGKCTLAVSYSGNTLNAGFDNPLTVTILNNGTATATVVDAHITPPSPIVLTGDNFWHFTNVTSKSSVKLKTSFYAPLTSAGTTYMATLSITYQTPYGTLKNETHRIGLIVAGGTLTNLLVSISGSEITGGYTNNVTFTLTNNGTVTISIMDAALTLPQPMFGIGSNKWRFTDILPNKSAKINVQIFSPASAIGNAYQGTLSLNYIDKYGNSKTDTHAIGFYIRGIINLVVYGAVAFPSPAFAGDNVTVTANLLNKGNVAAMYTNVSAVEKHPWIIGAESVNYLGQIDPNSPAPFSIVVYIDSTAKDGTFPLNLLITYQDERYTTHSFTTPVSVRVLPATAKPRPQPWGLRISDWINGIAVVVGAVIVFYCLRRLKVKPQTLIRELWSIIRKRIPKRSPDTYGYD